MFTLAVAVQVVPCYPSTPQVLSTVWLIIIKIKIVPHQELCIKGKNLAQGLAMECTGLEVPFSAV